jgi:DNA-binding helix-turn-helix protein
LKKSLKELRARENKTQVEMAGLLGVSVQTYNTWENNFKKLSIEKAKKVASTLNASLDEIYIEE